MERRRIYVRISDLRSGLVIILCITTVVMDRNSFARLVFYALQEHL